MAGGHLVVPLAVLAGGLTATVAVAVFLQRRAAIGRGGAAVVVRRTSLVLAAASAFAVGLVVTTAARVGSDTFDNGLMRTPGGQLLGRVVEIASDVDRDGYGWLGRPADPAPFDGRVYPYALDLPGNGIDEDGIGGDLPDDAGYAPATGVRGSPSVPTS